MAKNNSPELTAAEFIKRLKKMSSTAELKKYRRFFDFDENDPKEHFIGVRMGQVFSLAKEFIAMPIDQIEELLESPIHEARAGACSIMDKRSREKKTTDAQKKEMFDLYIRRHDRINNWDLVDLGCLSMTGSYLFDKPKKILYKLAKSKNMWERRSAIVSTTYFIRKKQIDDTFAIVELLIREKEDLVNKGVGWMLRFAGDVDRKRLFTFLEKHAATMSRVALRYSIEHLDKKQREYFMGLKKHE